MNVTVTKSPDGVYYLTKDGHGELFNGEVKVGAKPKKFGDCTLEALEIPSKYEGEPSELVVRFSYVDYMDTSNREVPGIGVRQRHDLTVPGGHEFGPYFVEATE